MVIDGASWQQLLGNLNPVTGTCICNQLLKLINEPGEQKKMIEGKRVLKGVSCFENRKEKNKRKREKKTFLGLRQKNENASSSRPGKIVVS